MIGRKKVFILFLCLCLLFSTLPFVGILGVSASVSIPKVYYRSSTYTDFVYRSGDYEYRIIKGGNAELLRYKGKAKEVTVPSVIDKKNVTSLSATFIDNYTVTKVTIPNSVKSIDHYTFDGCSSLKSIVIPDSVKDIEEQTFNCWNCPKLKDITILKENRKQSISLKGFEDIKSSYKSSNEKIVTVSSKGKATILGKGCGVSTISIYPKNNKYQSFKTKNIKIFVVPSKAKKIKIKKTGKQSVRIHWAADKTSKNYQIEYSTKKSFSSKKTAKCINKNSCKIRGLSKGKKYYVRIRGYMENSGKKYFGEYSTTHFKL